MDNKDLRQKLKQKINEKQTKRNGKTHSIKNKVNTNNDIYKATKMLMDDVAFMRKKLKSKYHGAKVGKMLKPKYVWLYNNYFPIFRATVFGEMNLNMLAMFLKQKEMIENNQTSQDDSDKKIGKFLGDKYNVDMDKLEKDLKEKYKDKK